MSIMFNQIFNTHVRNLSNVFHDPMVDVVITSLPYAGLEYCGSEGQRDFAQDSEKEYLPTLEQVFEQCFKATKDSCSLWIPSKSKEK